MQRRGSDGSREPPGAQQADGADRSRFTHHQPAAPAAAAHGQAVRWEGPYRTCLTSLLETLEDDDLDVHELSVTSRKIPNSSDARPWR